MSDVGVVIPDEVVALSQSHQVIGRAGMRDAENAPTMQRPSHWTISEDRRQLICFFRDDYVTSVRRCLQSNAQLAFNFSHTVSLDCYQIKGEVVDTRDVTEAELKSASERAKGFVETLESFGIAGDITARVLGTPSLAVTMAVREVFVQTPGPDAGRRIAPSAE